MLVNNAWGGYEISPDPSLPFWQIELPDWDLHVWTLIGKRARNPGKRQGAGEPRDDGAADLLAGEGKLKPVIDRELPLEHASDAHRAIEARGTFGKVILSP